MDQAVRDRQKIVVKDIHLVRWCIKTAGVVGYWLQIGCNISMFYSSIARVGTPTAYRNVIASASSSIYSAKPTAYRLP